MTAIAKRKSASTSTSASPSKTTIERGPLSFIEHVRGPRGGHIKSNFFAPPAGQIYSEGMQYGHEAGRELLRWMQAGCQPHVSFQAILEDAVAGLNSRTEAERGAVHAFLEVVLDAAKFAAKHGNFDAYFAGKATNNARWAEMERNQEERRIRSSIEARKAKRAARQEGGAA